MFEPVEFDYEKKLAELERLADSYRSASIYSERVIAVLVAVGALSTTKLEQARDIVSGLSE